MCLSISSIDERKAVVGIIGLGYVGYPLAISFCQAGFNVIGFDIDPEKIEFISKGVCYIRHFDEAVLRECVGSKKLEASVDFSRVRECSAVIICVPTPLDNHFVPDLSYVTKSCMSIAPHLSPGTLVSLESTTWPGTTSEVVQPILEKEYNGGKLSLGKDLFLCFSPEREDPGNPKFHTRNIPKLVGADDEVSRHLSFALYSAAVQKVVLVSSARVAECAKIFENVFRSVNIALVNEMKIILDKMGVDVWEVIAAASTKPFGFMPFFPGPGLGGHCIPIDPFYLSWKAKQFGITARFIELAGEINRSMPPFVVSKVFSCLNSFKKPLNGSRILVLGLAYKPDIDDIRESPSLELIRLLQDNGCIIEFNDPHISVVPRTREYPFLCGKRSVEISGAFDCIVVSTNHSAFNVQEILDLGVPIVDTRNMFPRNHPLVFPA